MPGNALDLEKYIPALLVFLSNKLTHGGATLYRRLFGVGISDWRILAMLAVEPDIPAHRICQVIGFDKALVSRVVQALARRGLVSVKPDANDSRRHVISLTREGRRLHDRIIVVAFEREKLLLSGLSPEEAELLASLLRRLLGNVDAVNAHRPRAASAGSPARRARRRKRLPQAAE
jgi:DNA-binding MarR family transcriptional regulator